MTTLPSSLTSRRSSELSFHISSTTSPAIQLALNSVSGVLTNQNRAISYLVKQYKYSTYSQNQLKNSLLILNNAINQGGKIIVSGIGKSYKIASKTVATLNSLSVHSALLHPSEALHGDLGMVREDHGDALILISVSGNSPELTTMLKHVPNGVPVVLVTCTRQSTLARDPKVQSLLYVELPARLSEKNLYGLSAPTISTTLCLTILDAVSIALGELHGGDLEVRRKKFGDRHPGGAIGLDYLGTQDRSQMIDDRNIVESVFDTVEKLALDTDKAHLFEEGEEDDGESDALDFKELKLINSIKLSDSKITIEKLPSSELELLQLSVLYDYILIVNDQITKAVESKTLLDVYRRCKLQGDNWDEINWKIEDALIKINC
ncbi:hypothetical protein CANARDRAFT_195616 [[Candida] arabinofermentans NRRL YB-2248]|uniref:SIS domain-containing protein n=1 Tax=[Candida] arabinofermentans NRRL YB-2248 TaxID=983967 RepID=A0A1E4T509_9ASCO|nr:hypothetical protein CANARDRAFT_195616 [[Candida] arabinofermentans NRRL YB-2248]